MGQLKVEDGTWLMEHEILKIVLDTNEPLKDNLELVIANQPSHYVSIWDFLIPGPILYLIVRSSNLKGYVGK